MIDEQASLDLARRRADAERTRTPIAQVSRLHPELTVDDAYVIQRAGVRLAEQAGRGVRARKIGLRSKVMQARIEEPDHGVIHHDMWFGDGVAWLADRLARHGVALRAGELVLAGSFTRPLWVRPGDELVADYGPLGTIAFRFSTGE